MKISQREAQRLRKQVKAQAKTISDFEWSARRLRRGGDVEGVEIFRVEEVGSSLNWAVRTAQQLGHIVVARNSGNSIIYRAMPLPVEEVRP